MMKHGTQSVPKASAPVDSVPLPCPFCGGTNVSVDPDIESVACRDCMATGPSLLKQQEFDTDKQMMNAAIDVWNARPTTVARIKTGKGSRK